MHSEMIYTLGVDSRSQCSNVMLHFVVHPKWILTKYILRKVNQVNL